MLFQKPRELAADRAPWEEDERNNERRIASEPDLAPPRKIGGGSTADAVDVTDALDDGASGPEARCTRR